MTASALHRLFQSMGDPDAESFEGGRDGWQVSCRFGDINLTLTETTFEAHCLLTRMLSDEDLDDLELALRRARAARDAYRANELERSRNG